MITINLRNRSIRKCAFCKHWYDPTNSAIYPKSPQIGLWVYNDAIKNKCLLTNLLKPAGSFCLKYECKI